MKKSGASTEEILDSFVMKATQGICPKKFEKSVLSGNAYKTEDLIDSSILKLVDNLCDGDLDLKTIMIGGIAGIRYRMRFIKIFQSVTEQEERDRKLRE